MRLVVAPPRPAVAACAPLLRSVARSSQPLLYSGEDGDASKCPFFGGPNGGGIGDANIATGALFVLVIVLLNRLIVLAAAIGPRRLLAMSATAAGSALQAVRSGVSCWRAAFV